MDDLDRLVDFSALVNRTQCKPLVAKASLSHSKRIGPLLSPDLKTALRCMPLGAGSESSSTKYPSTSTNLAPPMRSRAASFARAAAMRAASGFRASGAAVFIAARRSV